MKDVEVFQLWSMAGILAITLLGGLAPLKLTSLPSKLRNQVVGLLNFYSGGVFLGAGMLHMLPDAVKDVGDTFGDFPFVYFAACIGFVLVWAIDKSSLPKEQTMAVSAKSQTSGGASICYVDIEPVASYGTSTSGGNGSRGDSGSPLTEAAPLLNNGDGKRVKSENRPMMHTDTCNDVYTHGGHSSGSKHGGRDARLVSVSSCDQDVEEGSGHPALHTHEHHDVHHHVVFSGDSMLPFLLAFLFCVHSFFAGLALGVKQEVDGGAVAIVVAIFAHKVVEAVSITTSFIKEEVAIRTALPVILVYCFMTPLGVAVGMIMNALFFGDAGSGHVSNMIQAFAAGSFVFLANHAMEDAGGFGIVIRTTLVTVGLGSMALLAVWM